MTDTKEPLISVDLQSNGGMVTFWTIEEIEAWIKKEQNLWSWLHQVPNWNQQQILANIFTDQLRHFGTIVQQIQNYKNQQNPELAKAYLRQISQVLLDAYLNSKSLHSSTSAAKFLDELRKEDPTSAAYALGYFIRKTVSSTREFNISAIRGIIQAVLFDQGIKENAASERIALEELRKEYKSDIEIFKKQLLQTEQAKDNLDNFSEKMKNDFNIFLSSSKENFQTIITDSIKELDNIKQTYDEKLALQASVKYWMDKADNHKKFSKYFSAFFGLSLLASAGLLYYEIDSLFKNKGAAEHLIYGILAVSVLVVVWSLRIIVRVLLSHIHLERDATERVTMILTYLAMLREGQMPKEENRTLILQTLFRPSSSGIIKDDAMPSSFWELLTRTGTSGNK